MPRIEGRDLACDPKTGLLYRPGTADKATLGYVRTDYKRLEVGPGDLVLDLGANIGAYTHLAIRRGVARVLAVEPEPECCAIWRENLIGWEDRAELVEAAGSPHPRNRHLARSGGTRHRRAQHRPQQRYPPRHNRPGRDHRGANRPVPGVRHQMRHRGSRMGVRELLATTPDPCPGGSRRAALREERHPPAGPGLSCGAERAKVSVPESRELPGRQLVEHDDLLRPLDGAIHPGIELTAEATEPGGTPMKARSAADARHQNEREQYEQIEHKATHAEREKAAADDRIEELYAEARARAAKP